MSAKQKQSRLPLIGLILSIFIAPVGLVVSIVAAILSRKSSGGIRSFANAGIAVGVILTPIFVIAFGILFAMSPYNPYNQARIASLQQAIAPIAAIIKDLGTVETCNNVKYGAIDTRLTYEKYFTVNDNQYESITIDRLYNEVKDKGYGVRIFDYKVMNDDKQSNQITVDGRSISYDISLYKYSPNFDDITCENNQIVSPKSPDTVIRLSAS